MHACIIGLPALTRSCAWIELLSTSCFVTVNNPGACGQFQINISEEETIVIFWEQNNYLKPPIPWFWAGVDFGAASWLVTRLESRYESTHCEKRAHLVVGSFSIDMPFTNMVDLAISRCCKQVLNHMSCRKIFWMARYLRIGHSPSPLVKSEGCENSNQHVLYIRAHLYVQWQGLFLNL